MNGTVGGVEVWPVVGPDGIMRSAWSRLLVAAQARAWQDPETESVERILRAELAAFGAEVRLAGRNTLLTFPDREGLVLFIMTWG